MSCAAIAKVVQAVEMEYRKVDREGRSDLAAVVIPCPAAIVKMSGLLSFSKPANSDTMVRLLCHKYYLSSENGLQE